MKRTAFSIIAVSALLCAASPSFAKVVIVPQPVSIEYSGKGVSLTAGRPSVKNVIDPSLAEEEYLLDASGADGDTVYVRAGSEAGLWWAEMTLREILAQSSKRIPGLKIEDRPEFAYRGAHLDCCRHFFSIDDVKKYIDILSLHKINVFHWHLTDDQGWRAEIRRYPLLTEIGSKRGESGYGGFYTQEQMKEIVAYAAERHITVIPEIEMPGHALSVLASYPELGCTGGPYKVTEEWGVFPDVLCIGKEKTFEFLENVLDEICTIFPGKYIHIGGDEAPRTRWKTCPDCQRRMKEQGIKTEDGLQGYLVCRIEEYLKGKGRCLIGWDEILDGGVTPSATVMSWRGTSGGIKAARMGNDVIMSPHTHFYLDYYQTLKPHMEPEGTTYPSYLPLRKCYSFDPYASLDKEQRKYIKGIQANVWTEHMYTIKNVEHMVLPRLAALSETSWSTSRRTSYDNFVKRITQALLPIYEARGYDYADYVFRKKAVE